MGCKGEVDEFMFSRSKVLSMLFLRFVLRTNWNPQQGLSKEPKQGPETSLDLKYLGGWGQIGRLLNTSKPKSVKQFVTIAKDTKTSHIRRPHIG